MKNFLKSLRNVLIGSIIGTAAVVGAVNITVPAATSAGLLLQSLANGQYKAVQLIAGSNVTISTTTSAITISSTGGSGGGIADPFTHPAAGQSATTSLMLMFGQASTSQLTATSSTYLATQAGKVGIGTTTPLDELSVFGGGVTVDPGNAGDGFTLAGRPNISPNLPVPYFTPIVNNQAIAFDIFPKGVPTGDFAGNYIYGVAWQDICSDDINNGTGNYECLHLGKSLPSGVGGGVANVSTSQGGTGVFRNLGLQLFGGFTGVSTSSPAYTLTSYSATAPQLALSAGANISQWTMRNAGGNLYVATTTAQGVATSSLSSLTINTNGNVGIATTGPMFKLSVVGDEWHNSNFIHFGNSVSNNTSQSACSQRTNCIEFVGSNNTTDGINVAVQNINNGTSAYSGLTLLNSLNGNATTNYAGLFLNSPVYNDATFGTLNNVPNLMQLGNSMGGVSIQSFATTAAYSFINFSVAATTAGAGPAVADEKMRITTTGVGIGTTTPDKKLSIFGSMSINPDVGADAFEFGGRPAVGLPVPYLQPTQNNQNLAFDLFPKGTPGNYASSASLGVTWQDICSVDIFLAGNYECLHLAKSLTYANVSTSQGGNGVLQPLVLNVSGGNVAVGQNNTTPQYQFVIASSTAPQLSLMDTTSISQWTFRNAAGNLYLSTTTANGVSTSTQSAFSIANSTGNVGIGTDAAFGKLDVFNANVADSGLHGAPVGIRIMTTNPATANAGGVLTLGGNYTGNTNIGLAFLRGGLETVGLASGYLGMYTVLDGTGTVERARITSAGNFGIGTSTPKWLLNPASATAPQLALSAGAGIPQWTVRNAGGDLFFSTTTVQGLATTSTAAMTLSGSGKPGLSIGSTTPFATLSVNPVAGNYSNQFVVGSSTATNFRIDNSGFIYAPNTSSSGSAQTGYWCYDGSGQLIRDTVVCIVSDLRAKDVSGHFGGALAEITQLDPITYHFKPKFNGTEFEKNTNYTKEQLGLGAQDLFKVDPKLVQVYTEDGCNDVFCYKKDEPRAPDTYALVTLALQGVKELAEAKGIVPIKRSMEENWQTYGLILAFLLIGIQQYQIKKLKK